MSDESYPIGLRNNLLTKEHYEMIGSSIWVYMWLYDRITEEYDASGEVRGRVLGGAVIKARAIAETFDVSAATVRSHIHILKVGRYITARSVGDGFQLEVRNSHKRRRSFTPKTSSLSGSDNQSLQEQQTSRVEGIYHSDTLESFDSRDLPLCNSREPSNKTLQLDQDIAEDTPPAAEEHTHASEGQRLWMAAVDMFAPQTTTAAADVLRRCRVLLFTGSLISLAEPDKADRDRVDRHAAMLRLALREVSGRDIDYCYSNEAPNNEARAGPEVSPDADAAADP